MDASSVEEQLVSACRQLVSRRWQSASSAGSQDARASASRDLAACPDAEMSLLHLAAALGFLRVICTLLNWRLENSSAALEQETNPLACDSQGFTPLVKHSCLFTRRLYNVHLVLFQLFASDWIGSDWVGLDQFGSDQIG